MKLAFDLHTKENERRLWTVVLTFSAAVILGLGFLGWRVSNPAQGLVSPDGDSQRARTRLHGHSGSQDLASSGFDSPLTFEVDRLNHAFQSHPEMDVEEMIAKVNSSAPRGYDPPCPLAWHDNDATLSLRTDAPGTLSPTHALTTCADAVEKLP